MMFLSLCIPAVPPSGPPDPEHMAQMGRLVEEMSKTGVLVTTGAIKSRNTGMKVARHPAARAASLSRTGQWPARA